MAELPSCDSEFDSIGPNRTTSLFSRSL
jgi:hypothetical protein